MMSNKKETGILDSHCSRYCKAVPLKSQKERSSLGIESKCGMKGGKERKCLVWCIPGRNVIMPGRIQDQKTQGKAFKKKHTLGMDLNL